MNFGAWIIAERERRGWDQSELVRRANAAGFHISQTQISRIENGERQGGPEACIAIAYALRLPREEVFRARGWLLYQPTRTIALDADPRAIDLAEAVSHLPLAERERVLNAWEATLMVAESSGPYNGHPHARLLNGERPTYEVGEQTTAPTLAAGAGKGHGGSVGETLEELRSPSVELAELIIKRLATEFPNLWGQLELELLAESEAARRSR